MHYRLKIFSVNSELYNKYTISKWVLSPAMSDRRDGPQHHDGVRKISQLSNDVYM
jgi:hypothetical protein